jgi:hypothetical protein
VVNVGHDGEVADEIKLGHARDIAWFRRGGKGVIKGMAPLATQGKLLR